MAKPGKEAKERSAKPTAPKPTKAKRLPLFFGGFVLIAGAAVWFAPAIAANSGLRDWAIESAVPVKGRLTAGGASLGWFSPVVLRDVELFNHDGKQVAHIASITSEKTLLSLALDSQNLGRILVDHPQVQLELRDGGSNLEDTLEPLLKNKKPHAPPISVDCLVTGGEVRLVDTLTQRQHDIAGLSAHVALPGVTNAFFVLETAGQLTGQSAGASFQVSLVAQATNASHETFVPEKVTCQVTSLPLDVLQPLVRRFVADARLAGQLTSNITCTRSGDAVPNMLVDGTIEARELAFAAAALGTDEVRLAQVRIPCQLVQQGDVLQINQLGLTCELGQISAQGRVKLGSLTGEQRNSALLHSPGQVQGQLDLAQLARLLPHTLRLREGTVITGGQVQLQLTSQNTDAGQRWTGQLRTSNLTANNAGQQLEWRDPVVVDLAAHENAGAFQLEQLKCASSFLEVLASGTADNLQGQAQFDLDRLVAELQQFVDFGDLRLAGRGNARWDWRRSGPQTFAATGDLQTTNFQLIAAGHRPWQEPSVAARFDAAGTLEGSSVSRWEQAALQVDIGDERLTAQLAQPVATGTAARYPLAVTWQGNVGAWLPRLEPWTKLGDLQLAGRGALQAMLVYADDITEVSQSRLTVEQFQARANGCAIDEPRVELSAAGRWTPAARRADIPSATLSAGQLAMNVTGASWTSPVTGPATTTGTANFQADLAQLERWLKGGYLPPTLSLAGQATGQLAMTQTGDLNAVKLTTTIDQFEVADRSTLQPPPQQAIEQNAAFMRQPQRNAAPSVWREPRVTIAAQGSYQAGQDLLSIDLAELGAQAVRAKVTGKVSAASTVCNLDVQGQLDYDWQQLAPLYSPYLGSGVVFTGRDSRTFVLRGPWTYNSAAPLASLARLTGEGSVGWNSIDAYGVQAGQGQLAATLGDGLLKVEPLELQVNGGKVLFAPTMQLTSTPAEILLPKGQVVQQVRVTPELCARALKYVAPILAEATVAEGNFSIQLDGARIPLADTANKSDVAGQMLVHSVQVKPGPLADQFILLGRQIAAIVARKQPPTETRDEKLLSLANQTVDFRLAKGRVYHQGLEFMAGEVPVRTSGSVGLDETLSLVAEVRILDQWVSQEPILSGFKGQSLQIPIEGTLTQPRVDRRAMDQLTGQLLQNAARGAVINQLDKQLEKLFPLKR